MQMRLMVLCAVLLACARNEEEATSSDTTATMLDNGAADTAQPAAPLSDANILALLDRTHMADSAAGAVAAQKGTSADVRAFGRRMVREHHALRAEGERVARRLRITPQLPADDESEAEAQETLALLDSTARGADFDKAYIDYEVSYHLDVLETATKSMGLARETELKAYIQKVVPVFEAHLDGAKRLQSQTK